MSDVTLGCLTNRSRPEARGASPRREKTQQFIHGRVREFRDHDSCGVDLFPPKG